MVTYCCVQGCKNSTNSAKKELHGVTFHAIPTNPEIRQKWLQAIGRPDWVPPSHSRICSVHFSEDQMKQDGCRIRIKEEAFPVNALPPNSFFVASQLKVCRICLATDVEMFSLEQGILKVCMDTISGSKDKQLNIEGLPQYVCYICRPQLMKSYKLVQKCLVAQAILLDIFEKNASITEDLIRKIDRTQLNLAYTFEHSLPGAILIFKHENMGKLNLNKVVKVGITKDPLVNKKGRIDVLAGNTDIIDASKSTKPEHRNDNQALKKFNKTNKATNLITMQLVNEGIHAKTEVIPGELQDINDKQQIDVAVTPKIENDDTEEQINDVLISKIVTTEYCDVGKLDSDTEFYNEDLIEANQRKRRISDRIKNEPEHSNEDSEPANKEMSDSDSSDSEVLSVLSSRQKKLTSKKQPDSKKGSLEKTTPKRKRRKLPDGKTCQDAAIEKLKCFNVLDVPLQEQIAEWKKECEQEVRPNFTFICELCTKKFPRKKTYDKHLTYHDKSRGDIQCPVCKERFQNDVRLKAHTTRLHSKRYECKDCPKVFHNLNSARRHWELHTGGEYRCGVGTCTYSTRQRSAVWVHRQREHASDHHCARCGRCFLSAKGLATHTALQHPHPEEEPKETFRCEECDVEFYSERAKRIHILTFKRHRSKANPEDLVNTCPRCAASFKTRGELTAHKHKEHPGLIYKYKKKFRGMPYPRKCEYCDKEMKSRNEHYWHVRRTHKDKKYRPDAFVVCEQCGKGFQNISLYRYHMSQHAGGPLYLCGACPRRFYSRPALTRHARLHSAHRPHACPHCGRAFRDKGNCLRHQRIHTGETPYECSLCKKKFKYWETLDLHTKHVHQKIPWPARARRGAKARKTKREAADEADGSD